MGWGKPKGAAPQPAATAQPGSLTDWVANDNVSETLFEEPAAPEKPSDAAKAEMEWQQFRVKKGWVTESVATLLYEFIRDRGLFKELIAFTKGKK